MRWLLLAPLAACAIAPPPPYSPDDYFRDLGEAHCLRMTECCTRSEYTDWWTADSTGDMYSCLQAHQNPAERPWIERGLKHGSIAFDIAAAHDCVAALEQLACTDFEPAIRFRETYCISPFVGTVGDGGPCSADAECIGTTCRITDTAMHTGVCESRVPDGATCDPTESCALGDNCQYPGVCALGLPANSECATDYQCADDWCKGSGFLVKGHCVRACHGQ